MARLHALRVVPDSTLGLALPVGSHIEKVKKEKEKEGAFPYFARRADGGVEGWSQIRRGAVGLAHFSIFTLHQK